MLKERLKSCGYMCSVDKWYIIQRICHVFKGSFSYNPHLSTHYSKGDLDLRDLKENLKVKCRMEVIDIRDASPKNWKIL